MGTDTKRRCGSGEENRRDVDSMEAAGQEALGDVKRD